MFTGLVTDIGTVRARESGRFTIAARYPAAALPLGASVACDGCCLSVTAVHSDGEGSAFSVDVSNETLSRTTLGAWQPGRAVNLELALRMGDALGGHFVAGHVDAVARILDITRDGESRRVRLEVPAHLSRFIAEKGSVALDGTSLTVNEVEGARFGVNLIPLTLTRTTWGRKKPGDEVNLEVDLLARYAARFMECGP